RAVRLRSAGGHDPVRRAHRPRKSLALRTPASRAVRPSEPSSMTDPAHRSRTPRKAGSDPRLDPLHCPHGEECGACALLDLQYAGQLQRKRERLGREIRRYERLRGAALLPTMPSPHKAAYRSRAKMAVGISRHGDVKVGYFRSGTREIVDARDCRVL